MNVGVVGCGHVGSVIAAGMAELGHDVVVNDADEDLMDDVKFNEFEIDEPGVPETFRHLNVRPQNLDIMDVDVMFIAVPTPVNGGEMDISNVEDVIQEANLDDTFVVIKSTIPPGTCEYLSQHIPDNAYVGHNPEFLREGRGLEDFIVADRIVIGADNDEFYHAMDEIYQMHRADDIIRTDWETAEMSKLAMNTFLATKVTFANEIGRACDNPQDVMRIVGSDDRVNSSMLMPGGPWGGPCFPKDVKALSFETDGLIESVIDSNDRHVIYIVRSVISMHDPDTVGLVGVGFKAGSSNMSHSPAIRMQSYFDSAGIDTVLYDENIDDLPDPEDGDIDVAVICSPQSFVDFDCPVVDIWNSEDDATQLF